MSDNCHIEYSACLWMVVPLSATCSIVTAVPSFVGNGFVEANGEWEREDGADYSAKDSSGRYCGPELRGPTIDKWINLTGSMCSIQWGRMAAMTGNSLALDADDNVVGYGEDITPPATPCTDSTGPKFALLILTRAAQGDGAGPCIPVSNASGFTSLKAHIFPLVTDFKTQAPSIKDERRMVEFTAKAYANPNIGRGPWNLYPTTYVPTAIPPTKPHFEFFVKAGTTIPAPSCDAIVHPAVVAPV